MVAAHMAADAVARDLWTLGVWSDERHSDFWDITGRSPVAAFGQQMEGWPVPPVPSEVVSKVSDLLEKVEAAWGRTLDDVADEMGGRYTGESLGYYVIMQAIGHGVGPNDDGTFPESLTENPLGHISDPTEQHTPDPTDWDGFPSDTLD